MSDQDFFIENDKPDAKAQKPAKGATDKSNQKSVPKAPKKSTKPLGKATPSSSKKRSKKTEVDTGKTVSMTVAMLLALISLLLGLATGLYLNFLMGGTFGMATTTSKTPEPSAAERGIQSTHPDVTNMDVPAAGGAGSGQ